MTDPLGESQVIPYVLALTDRGYDFHLLSFEKSNRFEHRRARIGRLLRERGVEWVPMSFTAQPRLLAKAYHGLRLRRAVRSLHREFAFDLVHCRSYPAADAALALKKRAGVPYLFDMRGFWVDERVEGGIWNRALPHYAALYRHLKGREKAYLAGAAGVVSLTEAAVREMASWEGLPELYTEVIPCAVDTELFAASGDRAERARTRDELSVPVAGLVVGYLGSINTWYLLDDMMRLFAQILRHRADAWFVFITRHAVDNLCEVAAEHGIPPERIVAKEADRHDVPRYLECMDVSVFFIRPSYSKTASCPTKLGELMAVGVPSITNTGVGDVDRIMASYQAGEVLDDLKEETLAGAADRLEELLASPREPMVRGARDCFGLENAVEKYLSMYERILGAVPKGPEHG